MTTNEVTSAGLITKSLTEIEADLENGFKSIYGADINLDQNSPDGQMIGIFAQAVADLLDLITQVYNSFDPDAAEGAALDARVAINGIERNGGTYSTTDVTITVDRAMTLNGLDSSGTPFTVADDAGNQFYLVSEQIIVGAGAVAYSFRAVDIGAVDIQQNTITSQVTVVMGVTAVNNPDAADVIGVDEESDADLKLRRNVSLSVAANNSLDTMRANILDVAAVTDAYVWENHTNAADLFAIAGNTMWAIVEGGEDQDIAQVIYSKRSAGCGMEGAEAVLVDKSNGENFEVLFDRPTYVPLYIHFTLTAKSAGDTYDEATVKAALVAGLNYRLYDSADASRVTTLLATVVPKFVATVIEVSDDDITYVELLAADTPQHKFTVAAANITIT